MTRERKLVGMRIWDRRRSTIVDPYLHVLGGAEGAVQEFHGGQRDGQVLQPARHRAPLPPLHLERGSRSRGGGAVRLDGQAPIYSSSAAALGRRCCTAKATAAAGGAKGACPRPAGCCVGWPVGADCSGGPNGRAGRHEMRPQERRPTQDRCRPTAPEQRRVKHGGGGCCCCQHDGPAGPAAVDVQRQPRDQTMMREKDSGTHAVVFKTRQAGYRPTYRLGLDSRWRAATRPGCCSS